MKRMQLDKGLIFRVNLFSLISSHLESMRKTVELSLTTCCCTMTSVWGLLRRVSSCDSD